MRFVAARLSPTLQSPQKTFLPKHWFVVPLIFKLRSFVGSHVSAFHICMSLFRRWGIATIIQPQGLGNCTRVPVR